MNAFVAIVRRDLLLAARRKSEVLTALFFFMIVVSLFPLGIGPETAMLRRIAPGVLWVAALLAAMLSLGRLFAADHVDGTLEQMALSPSPLGLLVAGKIVAHWLLCGLPLALFKPKAGHINRYKGALWARPNNTVVCHAAALYQHRGGLVCGQLGHGCVKTAH